MNYRQKIREEDEALHEFLSDLSDLQKDVLYYMKHGNIRSLTEELHVFNSKIYDVLGVIDPSHNHTGHDLPECDSGEYEMERASAEYYDRDNVVKPKYFKTMYYELELTRERHINDKIVDETKFIAGQTETFGECMTMLAENAKVLLKSFPEYTVGIQGDTDLQLCSEDKTIYLSVKKINHEISED